MKNYIFDTETCGYHGPCVLIQYKIDDSEIVLHEVFCSPISETMELVEDMAQNCVIGFNLAYDWFHIYKIWTMLNELRKHISEEDEPRWHIPLLAQLESQARDSQCLKPRTALDLMLHARKGPLQTTMDRKDIRIRKVPKLLSSALVEELNRRIELPDYLFAKRKDGKKGWQQFACRDFKTGTIDQNFCDIVLKFAPSSGLKILARDLLGVPPEELIEFDDIIPEQKPIEIGWSPVATTISNETNGWWVTINKKTGRTWPGIIEDHIYHWRYNSKARRYATNDVVYTEGIYNNFGRPSPGDQDSILACQVGASRWRGFAVDLDKLRALDTEEQKKIKNVPIAPNQVYRYLIQVATEIEKAALDEKGSTKKVVLEDLSKLDSEMGQRAKEVLDARKAHNKHTLFSKILTAGRLHPAASVIGSLSSRMSGRTEVGDGKKSSSLNALGIQHDKDIRKCFILAFPGLILNGGDFEGFEVSIADARYGDPVLREQLLTCFNCEHVIDPENYRADHCPNCFGKLTKCTNCKKAVVIHESEHNILRGCDCSNCSPSLEKLEGTVRKLHGLFAMELFPGNTYEQIQATKGDGDNDLYDKGKRAVFGGLLYGGNERTLETRIGINIEDAKRARDRFFSRYKGVQSSQKDIFDAYCSMRQPEGIGSKVFWTDPADTVSSLNGFKRSFELENRICKTLFTLSNKIPRGWDKIGIRLVRRDREQKAGGAVRSALLGCAFQIQAANMRAATNHEIQATGAIITKDLQCEIWELQPCGVHDWVVQPLNVHDELMCPAKEEVIPVLEEIVFNFVEKTKILIPLIKIAWTSRLKNWAEK